MAQRGGAGEGLESFQILLELSPQLFSAVRLGTDGHCVPYLLSPQRKTPIRRRDIDSSLQRMEEQLQQRLLLEETARKRERAEAGGEGVHTGGGGGGTAVMCRKEGLLLKKGKLRRRWKKRWFIVSCGLLFYFQTQRDNGAPQGAVPLLLAEISVPPSHSHTFGTHRDDTANEGYEFIIKSALGPRRAFHLVAESFEERARWVRYLRDYVALYRDEKMAEVQANARGLTNLSAGALAAADHDEEEDPEAVHFDADLDFDGVGANRGSSIVIRNRATIAGGEGMMGDLTGLHTRGGTPARDRSASQDGDNAATAEAALAARRAASSTLQTPDETRFGWMMLRKGSVSKRSGSGRGSAYGKGDGKEGSSGGTKRITWSRRNTRFFVLKLTGHPSKWAMQYFRDTRRRASLFQRKDVAPEPLSQKIIATQRPKDLLLRHITNVIVEESSASFHVYYGAESVWEFTPLPLTPENAREWADFVRFGLDIRQRLVNELLGDQASGALAEAKLLEKEDERLEESLIERVGLGGDVAASSSMEGFGFDPAAQEAVQGPPMPEEVEWIVGRCYDVRFDEESQSRPGGGTRSRGASDGGLTAGASAGIDAAELGTLNASDVGVDVQIMAIEKDMLLFEDVRTGEERFTIPLRQISALQADEAGSNLFRVRFNNDAGGADASAGGEGSPLTLLAIEQAAGDIVRDVSRACRVACFRAGHAADATQLQVIGDSRGTTRAPSASRSAAGPVSSSASVQARGVTPPHTHQRKQHTGRDTSPVFASTQSEVGDYYSQGAAGHYRALHGSDAVENMFGDEDYDVDAEPAGSGVDEHQRQAHIARQRLQHPQQHHHQMGPGRAARRAPHPQSMGMRMSVGGAVPHMYMGPFQNTFQSAGAGRASLSTLSGNRRGGAPIRAPAASTAAAAAAGRGGLPPRGLMRGQSAVNLSPDSSLERGAPRRRSVDDTQVFPGGQAPPPWALGSTQSVRTGAAAHSQHGLTARSHGLRQAQLHAHTRMQQQQQQQQPHQGGAPPRLFQRAASFREGARPPSGSVGSASGNSSGYSLGRQLSHQSSTAGQSTASMRRSTSAQNDRPRSLVEGMTDSPRSSRAVAGDGPEQLVSPQWGEHSRTLSGGPTRRRARSTRVNSNTSEVSQNSNDSPSRRSRLAPTRESDYSGFAAKPRNVAKTTPAGHTYAL